MPAAAVIPAPSAYTDIAAVKALVVHLRVAGLSSGQSERFFGSCQLGSTLDSWPQPKTFNPVGESCSCQSLLQWFLRLCSQPSLVWAVTRQIY